MTVKDYPISLPYGSKDYPYGTAQFPYHRGDDYACPYGTELLVGSEVIGISGDSGMTEGPHCHVQEWRGDVYTTRKPQNAFKPGTVVATSEDRKQQWGKYITVSNPDGWNTTYCHLSTINVTPGHEIVSIPMPTEKEIRAYFQTFVGEAPSDKQIADYTQAPLDKLLSDLLQFNYDRKVELSRELGKYQAANGDATKWQTLMSLLGLNK